MRPDDPAAEAVAYGRSLLAAVAVFDRTRLTCLRLNSADLHFDAFFSDPGYAELCVRNLALRSRSEASPARVRLYLLDAEGLGWPRPAPWFGERFDRAQLNAALAAAGLRGTYLHDPRVWQFFDPAQGVGVQLLRRPGTWPAWESGGPLRAFLHWMHASDSVSLCHAGTVGVDGRGVLLVGAGGSGKSGTVLAAVAGGLDTAGDDYCLVGQAENAVWARPLFRILKQDPDGVRRAFGGSLADRLDPLNWQGKHEIHASRLPRDPFVDSLRIVAVVVPRIGGGRTSAFRPLEAARAMRALAPSSAFQLPDGERQGIVFAAALCRRLPCYEMSLSDNAAEIAASLEGFVRGMP